MIKLLSESKWLDLYVVFWGIILFIPFLGGVHLFDWDEINFAECAREMVVSNNYLQVQIDFKPFYEKPPFFIWLQAISFKIFGINEFAARFPNALFGIFTLLLIRKIGSNLFNPRVGILWVLLYTGSLLPHFYFRSGIIDPIFNFFIFSAIYFSWKYFTQKGKWLFLMSTISLGIAVLTKGPVALLIFGGVHLIYFILERERTFKTFLFFLGLILCSLIIPLIWFGIDWIENGSHFMVEFIKYQIRLLTTEDAGHGGFPGYHFVILLIGCFPASILAMRVLFKNYSETTSFIKIQKILLWFVLILFSIVQSKIVHYSSLAYFPVTFLAAVYLNQIIESGNKIHAWVKLVLYIIGGIIMFVLGMIPTLQFLPGLLRQISQNDVFVQSILNLPSHWKWYDYLPALAFLMSLLVLLWRSRTSNHFIAPWLITLTISVALTIYIFPARIEYYTQKNLIEFLKNAKENEQTVYPINHKSYAHLFYAGKKPSQLNNLNFKDLSGLPEGLLLFSRVDRPLDLNEYPFLKKLDERAGYIYYIVGKK